MVDVMVHHRPAHRDQSRPLVATLARCVLRVPPLTQLLIAFMPTSTGVLLKAAWIDGQGCVITTTSNTILAATFIYTMCFDFLVLTLTAVKLGITGTPRRDRSRIVRLIFDDGLIFFLVA